MADRNTPLSWDEEDKYWQTNFSRRPYASGSTEYDRFRPGYRYGYESATRYNGRNWNDVESDLSRGWNNFEHRGTSTWEQVKDAVRDAWDRVMGRQTVTK
jgi:hypothetical protein